jgi:hypothetical protein
VKSPERRVPWYVWVWMIAIGIAPVVVVLSLASRGAL